MSVPEIMYEVTWEWPPAMVKHDDPGTRKALATRGAANELETALRDSGFVNVRVRPADVPVPSVPGTCDCPARFARSVNALHTVACASINGPRTGRMSVKNPPMRINPTDRRSD